MLASLDCTLWPPNSVYLTNCIQTAASIVNLSPDSLMHCQQPQPQSSTTAAAIIKHKRALEDSLIGNKLDVSNTVLLRFSKPDSSRTDARRLAQNCLAVSSTIYRTNGFAECEAVKQSTIGPVPLIKTSAMMGYDAEEGSLSAGLRTEQLFALQRSNIFEQ